MYLIEYLIKRSKPVEETNLLETDDALAGQHAKRFTMRHLQVSSQQNGKSAGVVHTPGGMSTDSVNIPTGGDIEMAGEPKSDLDGVDVVFAVDKDGNGDVGRAGDNDDAVTIKPEPAKAPPSSLAAIQNRKSVKELDTRTLLDVLANENDIGDIYFDEYPDLPDLNEDDEKDGFEIKYVGTTNAKLNRISSNTPDGFAGDRGFGFGSTGSTGSITGAAGSSSEQAVGAMLYRQQTYQKMRMFEEIRTRIYNEKYKYPHHCRRVGWCIIAIWSILCAIITSVLCIWFEVDLDFTNMYDNQVALSQCNDTYLDISAQTWINWNTTQIYIDTEMISDYYTAYESVNPNDSFGENFDTSFRFLLTVFWSYILGLFLWQPLAIGLKTMYHLKKYSKDSVYLSEALLFYHEKHLVNFDSIQDNDKNDGAMGDPNKKFGVPLESGGVTNAIQLAEVPEAGVCGNDGGDGKKDIALAINLAKEETQRDGDQDGAPTEAQGVHVVDNSLLNDLEPAPHSAQAATEKRLMNTAKVDGETGQDDDIDNDDGDANEDGIGSAQGETETGGSQTKGTWFDMMSQVKDEDLQKEIMALIESRTAFQE